MNTTMKIKVERRRESVGLRPVQPGVAHPLSAAADKGWVCGADVMPWNLKRYYGQGDLHFITCTCYRRLPLLESVRARNVFAQILGEVREAEEANPKSEKTHPLLRKGWATLTSKAAPPAPVKKDPLLRYSSIPEFSPIL
jgi:hypothetical protein